MPPGPEGIRDEELADALWPEADGDAAYQSLKTTLHRLRALIGREEAVKVSEGRVTLDDRLCWIDAWAFERLLGEADGRDPQVAVPLLEKAVGLYQGFFLGREMEEPWLLAAGERLRSQFLRGVEKLGSLLEPRRGVGEGPGMLPERAGGGRPGRGILPGRHGLLPEPGSEGRGAVALYKRFEKRLKKELGIEPAAKTRAIRDSLLGEEGR